MATLTTTSTRFLVVLSIFKTTCVVFLVGTGGVVLWSFLPPVAGHSALSAEEFRPETFRTVAATIRWSSGVVLRFSGVCGVVFRLVRVLAPASFPAAPAPRSVTSTVVDVVVRLSGTVVRLCA